MAELRTLVLEDCRLLFRNFSGKEGLYNREGERSFCVPLSERDAQSLREEGWNVKMLKPREEEDEPLPYLKVKVNFNNRPPRVVMITSAGKTDLDERSVSALDWAEIKRVDLVINPSPWSSARGSGVAAYLKSMYVTIEDDPLEMRYMNVPHASRNHEDEEPNDD